MQPDEKGDEMIADKLSQAIPANRDMAIYHLVHEHEGFVESAQTLFQLVQNAEQLHPGKPRRLFLDIEGHRNDAGGFDADMLELQRNFLPEVLGPFLTEINAPLLKVKARNRQENDMPPKLIIEEG